MRPIKFRAWDINQKVYDVPTTIKYDDSGHIESVDTYHGLLHDGEFELEQYTGLKDKNGKEIYEGDIILWVNSLNLKGTVKWCGVSFWVDTNNELLHLIGLICTVIGNVHENLELLEVDE